MSGPLMLAPEQLGALRTTIDAFPANVRSRGKACFRGRRGFAARTVNDIDGGPMDLWLEVDLPGPQSCRVEWKFRAGDGWQGACTCPEAAPCEHAYAAGLALLASATVAIPGMSASPSSDMRQMDLLDALPATPGSPATASRQPPPTPSPTSPRADLPLVARLEERHGRALNKYERAYVEKLEIFWQRNRRSESVYAHQLAELGLLDRETAKSIPFRPLINGWWRDPPASALEMWQYLAACAEGQGHPIPAFMQPVTDTAEARAKVAKIERQHEVERWKRIFHDALSMPVSSAQAAIPEIRLRLEPPRLLWEFRVDDRSPWRVAKGGLVRNWFVAAGRNPATVSADILSLLREVQLRHLRAREQGYWRTSHDPQMFKLDEAPTQDLLHWLLTSETLRRMVVNEQGESYVFAEADLVWTAEPLAAKPDDVTFRITLADGSPPPHFMHVLSGDPSLALDGRTVYRLPPALPGLSLGVPAEIPREALATPDAVRHMRRAGVRARGDLVLPEVEVIELHPRFVCRLVDVARTGPCTGPNSLRVDLLARSSDDRIVQRWSGGRDAWTSLPGHEVGRLLEQKRNVIELDHRLAERAIPYLEELKLDWVEPARSWGRSMTRSFPEDFAAWAEGVRAAGIELECDPTLAGLMRAPDRARLEIDLVPAADGAGSGMDWFDVRLVVRAEDVTLTPEEIDLLLQARGRFVLLRGKGWRRLEIALDEAHAARLAELGLDPAATEQTSERQRYHAMQLADSRVAGLLPEHAADLVRERAARLRPVEEPGTPPGLVAELRPYQREGLHFLVHLARNGLGGVLADDMGLGKTVQALAWLLWLAEERRRASAGGNGTETAAQPQALRALVVCPKSVVTNWELETGRFAPGLSVAALGPRSDIPAEANIVVVNYTQLRLAARRLEEVAWDAVILDEGQNIKNPQSQTARAARELRAAHRFVLTGTPIENRALDLWSLFAFALPGLLGTQAAFKRSFNDRSDPLARARLAGRVRHFMLRRTKAQVAQDLPARVEEDIFVELENVQRKLYDAELKRARQILLGVQTARQFDAQRFNILQSLLRLRQICCDPELVGAATSSPETSAKVAALFDQIEPILEEGHKVLVFSQFTTMLEILRRELAERRIAHLVLTGQSENRQEIVDGFQNSPDIPVFLLSLKAGGSGLNLTAASYVVLFDPWWNPAVEAQAIDRTHRIGQVNQVIAYRLIARDTVEEKIRKLQKAKTELARAIVQEESLASVLNLDDLRFVLG